MLLKLTKSLYTHNVQRKNIFLFCFLFAAACSKQDDKIEIRVLSRLAGVSDASVIFRDVLKEFEAKYTNVRIIDESQGDESAFNNKLKADIASGTLPHIFRIQGVANLGDYIKNGLILNIEPLLKEDSLWGESFNEGVLNYYRVEGAQGIYGVPMESGPIGVFYNEELFKSSGIDCFPETWDELLSAVDKLKANNIIPIALGAKSTYMAGHLHNQIFFRWMGVESAKKLGSRTLKWTDADVVESLKFFEVLSKAGAFSDSAVGINDDLATLQFQNGEAAMIFTGPWKIGHFTDPEKTPVFRDIKVAKFPYFKEKPQFKDDDMQIISPYMINGKLNDEEKKYTLELVKMLTSKETARRFSEDASFLIPIKDIDIDPTKVSSLFLQMVELGTTSKRIAVDVFDYDPLPAMQDRTRNSIVGILLGDIPEIAAETIQKEIDKNQ